MANDIQLLCLSILHLHVKSFPIFLYVVYGFRIRFLNNSNVTYVVPAFPFSHYVITRVLLDHWRLENIAEAATSHPEAEGADKRLEP